MCRGTPAQFFKNVWNTCRRFFQSDQSKKFHWDREKLIRSFVETFITVRQGICIGPHAKEWKSDNPKNRTYRYLLNFWENYDFIFYRSCLNLPRFIYQWKRAVEGENDYFKVKADRQPSLKRHNLNAKEVEHDLKVDPDPSWRIRIQELLVPECGSREFDRLI